MLNLFEVLLHHCLHFDLDHLSDNLEGYLTVEFLLVNVLEAQCPSLFSDIKIEIFFSSVVKTSTIKYREGLLAACLYISLL